MTLSAASPAGTTHPGVRPRHRYGEPGFRRVNLALFAAGLATFALLYATQALLPALSRAYHASAATAGLTVSVSTGALGIAVIPVSAVSEALGRSRVMTWAVLTAAVLGLAAPLSPSFLALLVIRAVQGVTLAGLPAVAMAYLAEEVDPSSLGRAMGRYIAGNAIGGLSGRLVSSVVADLAGWRCGLAAVGLMALACAVVFRLSLPPSTQFAPASPHPGALWAGVRTHLADSALLRIYAVGLVLMASFVTVYNYLGYRLLGAPFHVSQSVVGLIFVGYLAGTVSSTVGGRLADRLSRRVVLCAAILVTMAGVALTLPSTLIAVVAGLVVLTAGFFAAHTVASGWVGRRARVARAQASALYLFAYYTGSSVGGFLGGVAYGHGGWAATAAFVFVLLASGLVLTTRLHGVRPGAPRPGGGSGPGDRSPKPAEV